jgi:ComF family protein
MLPAVPAVTHGDGPVSFRAIVYRYEDRAAQAVRRLKYNRSTGLAPWMAEEIAQASAKLPFDAVVPVPIHWSRWCWRGFNQSDLIAARLPSEPRLLRRVRATRPQVGLNREERLRNLEGAFAARPCVGRSILLIDDVVTSGQTATECAKALLEQGAKEVGILALCGEAWD